jgi:hypothetical protein
MKRILFLLLLLTFVGRVHAADHTLDFTPEITTNRIQEEVTLQLRYNRHLIILDHQSNFVHYTLNNYGCYITYAWDLGYGYSRGPFYGNIRCYYYNNHWQYEFNRDERDF